MESLDDFIQGVGGVPEAYGIANALSGSGEEYINDPSIEAAWAIKAYENAQVHMSLISSCDPRFLKLSDQDDEIYEDFRKQFPNFPIEIVSEEALKSPEANMEWRNFMEKFKTIVEDYNFGSLLRLDANGLYDSDNTTLVPRVQFLAVEVARNREGVNSKLRNTFQDLYNKNS